MAEFTHSSFGRDGGSFEEPLLSQDLSQVTPLTRERRYESSVAEISDHTIVDSSPAHDTVADDHVHTDEYSPAANKCPKVARTRSGKELWAKARVLLRTASTNRWEAWTPSWCPKTRWSAWLIHGLYRCWCALSNIVILDWVYNHVWSRSFAFICVLRIMFSTIMIVISELLPLDYAGDCFSARAVNMCTLSGDKVTIRNDETMEISLKYLGAEDDLKVTDNFTFWLVVLFSTLLLNSRFLANGRKIACWRCCPRRLQGQRFFCSPGSIWQVILIAFVSFNLCRMIAEKSRDLKFCGSLPTSEVNWTQYQPRSGELFVKDPNGATLQAKQIADYCNTDVPTLDESYVTYGDTFAISRLVSPSNVSAGTKEAVWSDTIKNVWAGWMSLATFGFHMTDINHTMQFCDGLFKGENHTDAGLLHCLEFLNASESGNRIKCVRSPDIVLYVESLRQSQVNPGLSSLRQHLRRLVFRSLSESGCTAIIAGSNFALGSMDPRMSSHSIATAVISLLTQGLHCPSDGTEENSGLFQLNTGFNESTCTYPPLPIFHSLREGSRRLATADGVTTPYLQRPFVACAIREVRKCGEHRIMEPLSAWLSVTNLISAMVIWCGLLWAFWLKLVSLQRWDRLSTLLTIALLLLVLGTGDLKILGPLLFVPFVTAFLLELSWWKFRERLEICCTNDDAKTEFDDTSEGTDWSEVIRIIFSSRVFLGFALAGLTQISLTYGLVTVLWPLLDRYKYLCRDDPYCINFGILGPKVFTWVQCFIVFAAIWRNSGSYWQFRKQVMKLEYDVFFGEKPHTGHWDGPDLQDVKEMGSTSVLLAMQFPTLVVWHFLVGSFLLVLILSAGIVPFLVAACGWNPGTWRATQAVMIVLSVHLADYITRIFGVQPWLLEQPHPAELDRRTRPVRIRCLSLFSFWELRSLAIGLAIGPFRVVSDFVMGIVTTVLSNLVVDKPNFTQFGEFSDYVYCTYCAAIYLERLREERRLEIKESKQTLEGDERQSSLVGNIIFREGHLHSVREATSTDMEAHQFMLSCPCRCTFFLVLQFGLPLFFVSCFVPWLNSVLPLIGSDTKYSSMDGSVQH
eukprot:TRINITY_DN61002_c0_g1_i1.p1 TRINITY_DN61002_c0_g1~~TRINITY_DN61002_c0_g1_i1.p1  ORF type:complete len:1096 (+),score=104.07 TRINITY_DN61002_c0_g1_i1:46-3288(+)